MRPIQRPSVPPLQSQALDALERTPNDPRLRTRAQRIRRSAAPGLTVPQMAALVRAREATVGGWRTRERAAGLPGVRDVPRPGRPAATTAAYRAAGLAAGRRRPRRRPLPCSWWTLQGLADELAARPGRRVSEETVRRPLTQVGLGLSRPQPQISRPDPDY